MGGMRRRESIRRQEPDDRAVRLADASRQWANVGRTCDGLEFSESGNMKHPMRSGYLVKKHKK